MATLDKLLDAMASRGATALLLKTGELPQMQTPAGLQTVAKAVLQEAHVVAYLKELGGASEQTLLAQRRPLRFSYREFDVEVLFGSSGAEAHITPRETGGLPLFPVAPPAAPPPSSPAAAPAQRVTGAASGTPAIDKMFHEMIGKGASDLHLTTGELPRLRLHGEMLPLQDYTPLTEERIRELLWPICTEKSRKEWEADHDTDFAYEVEGLARFRCNYFMDRTGMGAVFRQIPTKIPTAEQLGVPRHVLELCWLSKGFVVVTGPTGSGKSTTLASLVDYINDNRTDHIITIEDPIEFVHANKRCLLNQREVGMHTTGFKRALRAALREDPDIVLVGEMRDLETIAIAIETAETGHLVFGTLHTTTAPTTIDRIIDQFPADRQAQIRTMLSETIKGVIAQTLCKKIGGGRVAAFEILIVNSAMANLIREGKTFQIPSLMQTQKSLGNLCLNDSLIDLVKKGVVEPKEAYIKAVDKTGLKGLFERAGVKFDPDRDMGAV